MAINISAKEIILSLAGVIDLVSTQIKEHHKRTAYIACKISEAAKFDRQTREDIFIAAMLHDCGALSLKDKLMNLEFDLKSSGNHSELGYRLLRQLTLFENAAKIVKYHHQRWNETEESEQSSKIIPDGSWVLHIADRIDVVSDRKVQMLDQAEKIRSKILKEKGNMFAPEWVDVFSEVSTTEDFWNELDESMSLGWSGDYLMNKFLSEQELFDFSKIIEKMIDFRSRFTATHSRGVAVVAEELACLLKMDKEDVRMIRLAGAFHDIGKLGVPAELIEKQGKLSLEEYDCIRNHALLTYETLKNIKGLEKIAGYAAYHHERLDGSGYPFGLQGDELSLGARIVAVADMFTAMTEDRPYREGMSASEALGILEKMADSGKLDVDVVKILGMNLNAFLSIQQNEQKKAVKEYESFIKEGIMEGNKEYGN